MSHFDLASTNEPLIASYLTPELLDFLSLAVHHHRLTVIEPWLQQWCGAGHSYTSLCCSKKKPPKKRTSVITRFYKCEAPKITCLHTIMIRNSLSPIILLIITNYINIVNWLGRHNIRLKTRKWHNYAEFELETLRLRDGL